jgi:O-acetyl-ADP-ribose deacetylase (regulator of RNase III)
MLPGGVMSRLPADAQERIEIIVGDITTIAVDAVVNAANETLLGGGGVDGAIHRAAGPGLRAACQRLPQVRPSVRCPTGEARLTLGFDLPAGFVIHTVGPVWHGGCARERSLLARCYQASLRLAADHGLKTVAVPAISCGAYGFPVEAASAIAMSATYGLLASDPRIERVVFVAFSEPVAEALRAAHRALADRCGGGGRSGSRAARERGRPAQGGLPCPGS